MEISLAVISDIPTLCILLDTLFSQEAEFVADNAAQIRGLEAIINGPDTGDIFVARENGQITGMVSLLYSISTALGATVCTLEDMVVSEEGRSRGTGASLLKFARDFAIKKGCRRITLLTDQDNVGAQRFYEKNGYSRSSMVAFRMSLDDAG
ncbi:MAG: GNAT family N-acetyltransferase [Sneathiella sp.]